METPTISRSDRGQIAFVPATVGWFIVEPIFESDDEPIRELVKIPVVAWKIETHTCRDGSTFQSADAITIEMSRKHECLQSPDGHFYIAEETDFANEAEVIAYFNRREERRRSREEAQARSAEAGARA